MAHAAAGGDRDRALLLKIVLVKFILQHPRCDERHRLAGAAKQELTCIKNETVGAASLRS